MKSKVYEGLSFYEVGDIVNSIKYDNEDCILPKKEYEEKLHKKGLGKFFGKVEKPEDNKSHTENKEPKDTNIKEDFKQEDNKLKKPFVIEEKKHQDHNEK